MSADVEFGAGGGTYSERGGQITTVDEILSKFVRQPHPLEPFFALLEAHQPHKWEEVGPCVWCADCNVRLYQGSLPDDKAPANRAACRHNNQDWESGLGFYGICTDCGERIWAED